MKKLFLGFIIMAILLSASSVFANDMVYRQTFSHSKAMFTDSDNYRHTLNMPRDWRRRNLVFYRFETVCSNNASVRNPRLTNYSFSFKYHLSKSFLETVDTNITVLLFARRRSNVVTNPVNPNPNPQLPSDKWYRPGSSYVVHTDSSRIIKSVTVFWRDAGGNAKGRLFVNGIKYEKKDVGNGTVTKNSRATWFINRYASKIKIKISRDVARIDRVVVRYRNNYTSNPTYPTYPTNPNYNGNHGSHYNPTPTYPTHPTHPNTPSHNNNHSHSSNHHPHHYN